MRPQLGELGIWARTPALSVELAREVERCGSSAIWSGSSPAGALASVDELRGATDRRVVAPG
ncbi:MAG: hypothetical protein QOJ37_741, partial [Pseudonocardiales bacterium]|nr:hypothetical protein [Pseudonocardiales bacterium]